MKFSLHISAVLVWLLLGFAVSAQDLKPHEQAGSLNPIIPGYFADPTVKKIGDTYYIYATTDGNGGGLGPSQVWTSKDFKNWTIQAMNWPSTHWYWAPDMTQGYDGRYYLYYSQPVEIFGAVSDNPTGPWTSLTAKDSAIIPNYMIPGVITLDAQSFKDDDGKIYMFWGTWGIYPDHGCAVGILNKDMKSFEHVQLIPNTVAKDFFEAPYMFKRDGIYYFMYSSGHCEDETYRVQYLKSKVGPMGPFEYPANNPILVTNEDGSIHGPGHHSIIEEDGRYFIVYHRHNNPHSGGGFHRQVAVDELFFAENGDILNVKPTHEGVAFKHKSQRGLDLAFGKQVEASSSYSADFRAEFSVDDHNGTLWRSKENQHDAWLKVDLGKETNLRTVEIQFEYPTYAYQYLVETSMDGNNWTIFADQSKNSRWASPILEKGNAVARYVRLQILNTQLTGLPKGVWNIKVYADELDQETLWSKPQEMPVLDKQFGKLIALKADSYADGDRLNKLENQGLLQGDFQSEEFLLVKQYMGKKAFYFDGQTALTSSFSVPQTLAGNSPFTIRMLVNNPKIARFENILSWSQGNQDLTKAIVGFGSDKQQGAVVHGAWPDLAYSKLPMENIWNHIVISFDGYMERIYVNSELISEANRMLFIKPGTNFTWGASEVLENYYSGYIASFELFNEGLTADQVQEDYKQGFIEKEAIYLSTDDLELGELSQVRNHGSINPSFLKIANAKAAVIGNRTAIDKLILQDDVSKTILKRGNYTLEFDQYLGGEWQHVVIVNSGKSTQVFKQGILQKKTQLKGLYNLDDAVLSFKNPIHFLHLEPGTIAADKVQDQFNSWNQKLAKTAVSKPVQLTGKYINSNQYFVQIQGSKGLHYQFSSGNIRSGWITNPYYLFIEPIESPIHILAKDEFGNCSDVTVLPINSKIPTMIFDAQEKTNLAEAAISGWDGTSMSSLKDSTLSAIEISQSGWRLQSKHTSWGNPELTPVFLYKELTGDFSFEVQVSDVEGLSNSKRTSSEAGIMIQDAGNANLYVNNTVLTGWNLGNLIRSVAADSHIEGNNGTGLTFDSYLQVQKIGDFIFLRSSKDGIHWKDLPNSPIQRKDLSDKKLKVGLYQIAGNNQLGYGEFESVRIYRLTDN